MRKLCVSTGCFSRWSTDINKKIELIGKQDINGVELCFKHVKQLLNFNPSRKNLDYLQGLAFNTIHAPMTHIYKNSEWTKRVMNKVAKLYDTIDAKFVVIHPWLIKNYECLENSGMTVCIENNTNNNRRSKRFYSAEDIKEVLDAHPEIGLVLDVCHARMISNSLTGEFVKAFGKRIAYVHTSSTVLGEELHQAIHLGNSEFMKSIKPIKKLKCPIVLETKYPKGTNYYAKDIAFVKKNF